LSRADGALKSAANQFLNAKHALSTGDQRYVDEAVASPYVLMYEWRVQPEKEFCPAGL